MSWFKMDDQFFSHPKVREAGRDAVVLFVAAGCYCARHLTDGYVSAHTLPLIAAEAWVKPELAMRLHAAGLFDEADGGWRVHDYLVYNPSRAEVEAERERRSMAGAKGAAKRWHGTSDGTSHSTSHSQTHGLAIGASDAPGPTPKPTSPFGEDFDRWWGIYPRKIERKKALAAYRARRREGAPPVLLDAAAGYYATACVGTEPKFIKYPATFLARGGAWTEWAEGPPEAVFNGNGRARVDFDRL